MPAMDGIEATRTIRNQQDANQHVPIIALTADAAAETNAECMAAGADIFLTKPVMAKDLIDAIRFLRHLGHDDVAGEGLGDDAQEDAHTSLSLTKISITLKKGEAGVSRPL